MLEDNGGYEDDFTYFVQFNIKIVLSVSAQTTKSTHKFRQYQVKNCCELIVACS